MPPTEVSKATVARTLDEGELLSLAKQLGWLVPAPVSGTPWEAVLRAQNALQRGRPGEAAQFAKGLPPGPWQALAAGILASAESGMQARPLAPVVDHIFVPGARRWVSTEGMVPCPGELVGPARTLWYLVQVPPPEGIDTSMWGWPEWRHAAAAVLRCDWNLARERLRNVPRAANSKKNPHLARPRFRDGVGSRAAEAERLLAEIARGARTSDRQHSEGGH
jgi:hypothetical protein